MGETHILIRFLGCIFHGTGNSARLSQNFGIISGGGGVLIPPSGYASAMRNIPANANKQQSSNTCSQHLTPPASVLLRQCEATHKHRITDSLCSYSTRNTSVSEYSNKHFLTELFDRQPRHKHKSTYCWITKDCYSSDVITRAHIFIYQRGKNIEDREPRCPAALPFETTH
jgi:hypothetical protein